MSNFNSNYMDLEEKCKAFMAEKELPLEGNIIADEKIHRFGPKKHGWYIGTAGISSKGNSYLTVTFGSWRDGSKYIFNSFEQSQDFDAQELQELRNRAQENQKKAQQTIHENRERAAIEAQRIWQSCSENPPSDIHQRYFKAKKIKRYKGLRFGYNEQEYPAIIIPVYNSRGQIRSLQFISVDEDGKSYKSFLSDGEIKGNYHIIGYHLVGTKDVFIICEGYATGASIHEAVQLPVVVAFSAHNIGSVVQNIKRAFPNHGFVIAADADSAGIKQAEGVAKMHGCVYVTPVFPSDSKATDFNDLVSQHGLPLEEVRTQLFTLYVLQSLEDQRAKKYFSGSENAFKAFNLSIFPPLLRKYIQSFQNSTDAHPIMITASVLTMISAYLGTKVYIPEGEYFQDLYPNIWILCIAKSGQFKTTAINKGARIAYQLQVNTFGKIKELRENFSSMGKEDLEKDVLKISRENVVLPTKMTAEAFLEYLAQGHYGAIYASELGGWLQNLEKNHNNDFKAIITELYDVPIYYRYKTKTQGDCVLERPYISICGVSTLPWVRSNIKPTDVPSGFFARFIIFTPPFEEKVPAALPSQGANVFNICESALQEQLDKIMESVGHGRKLLLSKEAKEVFEQFHSLLYRAMKDRSEAVSELLQPYLKRWSPVLLKIAIPIQLFIDHQSTEITAEAIHISFNILNPAINSTIELFEGELGESMHQRKCRMLFDWIKKRSEKEGKAARRQDILASKQLDGGAKEYDVVLQDLIEQGKITYKEYPKKNNSEYMPIDAVEIT